MSATVPKYVAVTKIEDGELLGYINLETNEVIQKDDVDIRIGFGEPQFIDKNGKVFMSIEE